MSKGSDLRTCPSRQETRRSGWPRSTASTRPSDFPGYLRWGKLLRGNRVVFRSQYRENLSERVQILAWARARTSLKVESVGIAIPINDLNLVVKYEPFAAGAARDSSPGSYPTARWGSQVLMITEPIVSFCVRMRMVACPKAQLFAIKKEMVPIPSYILPYANRSSPVRSPTVG